MRIEAGRELLQFRLIEKIGEGGMGVVWKALDTTLNRGVAIKFLPERLAEEADRLARFEREAKLLASLNHPNIAGIYGIHEVSGLVFLSMELIDGEDLQQRLSRGSLACNDALDFALQIARAFEAAHESGVIHRDLKPANVKLTPDGKIKVLDFGLAKALSTDPSDPGSDSPAMSPTLTGTVAGMVLGTAAYMSPEQAKGMEVDRRADIWSFGVTLFEMLTGRRMFEGEGVSETLAAVIMKDVDLGGLPADTPRAIRRLLERCLERDPRERLRDIGEARISIEEALREPEAASTPATSTRQRADWRSILPWGLAVSALVALAWSGLIGGQAPESPPVMRFTLSLADDQPLGGSPLPMLAISGDGTRIAYIGEHEGDELIYLRHVHQQEATPLRGTEGADIPFFSPDGEWIGFEADGKLRKVSVLGGPPTTLCDAPHMRGASWGTDGTIVFAPDRAGGLMRVPDAGGEPEWLTRLGEGELGALSDPSDRWPDLLPGSRHVIYTSTEHNSMYGEARIVALSLEDGSQKTLIEGGTFGRFVPPGFLIYARQDTVFATRFDPGTLELTGPAVPILGSVNGAATYGSKHLTFSGNGTLVHLSGAARYRRESLVWFNRDGTAERASTHERDYGSAQLSPDGRHVALAIVSETDDVGDIWVLELERDTLVRLTFSDTIDSTPVWSPDGEWLTFASVREGESSYNLYRARSDGTGEVERLTTSSRRQIPTSWSPDGKVLAFIEWGAGTSGDLMFYRPDGDPEVEPFLVTPFGEFGAMISPDGRWVCFTSDMSGDTEIYVRPIAGGGRQVRVSTTGGTTHGWARDQKELLYRSLDDKLMAVSFDTDGDAFRPELPRELTSFPAPPYSFLWDPAPDGRILAYKDLVGDEAEPRDPTVVVNWVQELEQTVP